MLHFSLLYSVIGRAQTYRKYPYPPLIAATRAMVTAGVAEVRERTSQQRNGKYLMLHRVKKENDENKDK